MSLNKPSLQILRRLWHLLETKVRNSWKNEVNAASIKLNPSELGTLEIGIRLNEHRQADLMITTQHLLTKDSVAQALPRLREMLSDSGIQLNQVTIQDQSQKDPSRQQQHPFYDASDEAQQQHAAVPEELEFERDRSRKISLIRQIRPEGLIDFYA